MLSTLETYIPTLTDVSISSLLIAFTKLTDKVITAKHEELAKEAQVRKRNIKANRDKVKLIKAGHVSKQRNVTTEVVRLWHELVDKYLPADLGLMIVSGQEDSAAVRNKVLSNLDYLRSMCGCSDVLLAKIDHIYRIMEVNRPYDINALPTIIEPDELGYVGLVGFELDNSLTILTTTYDVKFPPHQITLLPLDIRGGDETKYSVVTSNELFSRDVGLELVTLRGVVSLAVDNSASEFGLSINIPAGETLVSIA